MHHAVEDIPVFVPLHKVELAGAFFNRNQAVDMIPKK